jgi:MFS family permease
VSAAAGVVAQTPAGALADRIHRKRELLAVAAVIVAIGSILTVYASSFALVFGAQILIGVAGAVFPPAISTISLGMVGERKLDRRVGRNLTLDSTETLVAAFYAGIIGEAAGQERIFYSLAAAALFGSLAAMLIRPEDINYELARGAIDEKTIDENSAPPVPHTVALRLVFSDWRSIVLFTTIVLYNLGNTALVPLISERFAMRDAASAETYTAAIIVALALMIPTATLAGRLTGRFGRKPLFLIGLAALPIRAALFTFNANSYYTISLQTLDGISASLTSVLGVLIVADLTRRTGHFGATRGALATATAFGVSLSTALAGFIAARGSFNQAFFTLAAVGLASFIVFWLFMPETKDKDEG